MEPVQTFNEFVLTVEMRKHDNNTKDWIEIFRRMNDEMSEALTDLEGEFRNLLGDKECAQQQHDL